MWTKIYYNGDKTGKINKYASLYDYQKTHKCRNQRRRDVKIECEQKKNGG